MVTSAAQARCVARDAYLALFPFVTAYGLMYREAIDRASPTYAGGFGRWSHRRSVAASTGHRSTAHAVLCSSIWLDVASAPWTLSIPAGRGHDRRAVLVTDLTGSALLILDGVDAASVAVVAPSWLGEVPASADRLVRGRTPFVRAEVTVETDRDLDGEQSARIQGRLRARPWDGGEPAVPALDSWPYVPGVESTMGFWPLANFVLTLTVATDDAQASCERAEAIGVGPGRPWTEDRFAPEILEAIGAGMDDALTDLLRSSRSHPAGESPASPTASHPHLLERALDALRTSSPSPSDRERYSSRDR